MREPRALPWTLDAELLVEMGEETGGSEGGRGLTYRVEGLEGVTLATAAIVAPGTPAMTDRYIRLRPLTDPPGPFDLSGIVHVTPFVEVAGARDRLVEFERRIGRRYYAFLATARWRYAAACDLTGEGIGFHATCAEVYSIDAESRSEAEALDESTSPEPPDIAAFYAECSTLKVPGSGRRIWLLPHDREGARPGELQRAGRPSRQEG